MNAPIPARVDVPAVAGFLAVTFGAAWLIASPLWLSGQGLSTPGAGVVLVAMMLAPTLGTLFVVGVLRRRPGTLRATGLRSTGGVRSWAPWAALAWLGPVVLLMLSLLLGAASGVFHPDLAAFSGLRETLRAAGVGDPPLPLPGLALLWVVQAVTVGWVNTVPALAEEWGWRGWLLPALLPLGRWPAILLVGVLWGLWHAPIVLLGYDYPLQPAPLRLLLMVGFCVVVGSLLGWLRLRSGSVWPSAIGHGFVNAAAGLPVVFAAADHPVDNATTGLLGWTGWTVMGLSLAVFAAARRRTVAAPTNGVTRSPEGDADQQQATQKAR
jgi:uncharacterized protein